MYNHHLYKLILQNITDAIIEIEENRAEEALVLLLESQQLLEKHLKYRSDGFIID